MKRVLLKTVVLLGLPTLIGYLASYFLKSQFYLIIGILTGVTAFVWVTVNKIRHLGRAVRFKAADSLTIPRD